MPSLKIFSRVKDKYIQNIYFISINFIWTLY